LRVNFFTLFTMSSDRVTDVFNFILQMYYKYLPNVSVVPMDLRLPCQTIGVELELIS
jgi:hypothetical protein